MTNPFQVVVLFDGTGLDGDSSSNVARLARALVRDERQYVILKNGSGTYHFAHLGGRIAGTDAMRILSDAYAQLARICEAHADEPPRVFLFGFSRGALYARVLAACLAEVGVTANPSEAKRVFKAWRSDDKEIELARFRQTGRLRPVDVRYLGAWDTVDATVGIDGADFIDVPRAVHAALRQGLRLKDGVKLSEALASDPVIHNSLGDATNFWGALGGIRRKIDSKRLHRSVKKILSRILAPDGTPILPEVFDDAPAV